MIKISVASTVVEPVSVAELKTHLRIDSSAEDTYLGTLISVARQQCELRTHRLLRPGTVSITMDSFAREIELKRPPLRNSSNLSISYINSTGGTTSLSSTVYELHDDSDAVPPILSTAYGQTWPTPQRVNGAITISYEAGYSTGATGIPLPDALRQWILMVAGAMYEQREATMQASASVQFPFLDGLLDEFTVHLVDI
jgi:uncharacterized phiE125 gp8 family phage protein